MSNFRVIVAFNRVDYFQQQFNAANERNYGASIAPASPTTSFDPALRAGAQPGAAGRARLRLLPDRGGRLHRRPADRLPALRQQLLHAAAPARGACGPRSSWRWPASIGFRRCWRSSRTCRSCRAGAPTRGGRGAGLRSRVSSATCRPAGAARRDVLARAGQDLRARRADRRRQDHDRVADGAALRSDRRTRAARRPRHPLASRRPSGPAKIGFILQEPFLFTGTVRDNIVYGNDELRALSDEALGAAVADKNLDGLLARFEQGLETKVTAGGDGLSLGQKQLDRLHARGAARAGDSRSSTRRPPTSTPSPSSCSSRFCASCRRPRPRW